MRPTSYLDNVSTTRQMERVARAFGVCLPGTPSEHFHAFRDYQIHIDELLPAGPPRGTVVLLHGAGAHGRALMLFAAPLLASGFRVIAPDMPGYGLTQGPLERVQYGDWVELVSELARQAAQQGPVVLFGLSAGGMTALLAAQRSGAASAVIVTSLLDLGDAHTIDSVMRTRWLGRAARVLLKGGPSWLDQLGVPLRWVLPIETLTTDRELARLLLADPLVGRLRAKLSLFRSFHAYALPAQLDPRCPLLLVHPGADHWTPLSLSQPVYDRIVGPKKLVLLSNGSHAPLEQPAFSELSSEVRAFLREHVRASVPPASHPPGPAAS